MAKILQYPQPQTEKPKRTLRARDNGERLEVIAEDGERVVAKSRSSGKWYLLRKLLDGGYCSVGEV